MAGEYAKLSDLAARNVCWVVCALAMRSLWGNRGLDWQSDHKFCSFAQCAFSHDVSAMSQDYLPGDSQAQTCTGFTGRRVSPVKPFKDMTHLLCGYAGAGIGYRNLDEVGIGVPGNDADITAGWRVFQGII